MAKQAKSQVKEIVAAMTEFLQVFIDQPRNVALISDKANDAIEALKQVVDE